MQMSFFDPQTGRQIKDWNNKLIWGDNKFILSSLKKGKSKVIVDKGQVIKIAKDKDGIVTREGYG